MSIKIALAGNPNSGKTTLFNALTGSNQFVGNWPGVTVEKKEGKLKGYKDVTIMDLPGIYSLSPYTLEEVVARNYLIGERPDAILNIVDGTNIERNLYLSTQLMELGIPVIMAVNMMDVLEKSGDQIHIKQLSEKLGCEVTEISALKGTGIKKAAEKAVALANDRKAAPPVHTFDPQVEEVLNSIESKLGSEVPAEQKRFFAIKMLEKDDKIQEQMKLVPDVSDEIKKIEEIMDENVIYAKTLDDQEEVAETIRKYGLIAIPIIDHEMCMVGIVTVDDAMFVLQDEATEDISIMAGVSPSEGSYFGTSVFRHAKNRSLWLMLLMLSATVTGEILGRYESAMAVMPVLITFIPMLMGTGGNCGSQSSTLVIRGIAVGEIEFKDIFRVIFKEVRIALVVSLILAMVNGLRIYIMYDQDVMLAVAIGITMIAVVVMAKTIGCVLPLAAKKIGLDPAIMAAPLITTILDTCTILVYFRIVTAFFHI